MRRLEQPVHCDDLKRYEELGERVVELSAQRAQFGVEANKPLLPERIAMLNEKLAFWQSAQRFTHSRWNIFCSGVAGVVALTEPLQSSFAFVPESARPAAAIVFAAAFYAVGNFVTGSAVGQYTDEIAAEESDILGHK